MTRSNLSVSLRTETGNGPNRRLRALGTVPAVVYTKGKAPVSVSVDPKAVIAHLKGPFGRNGVIDLQVEGEGAPRMAIIRQYTVHPWKRSLEHIDFWEITPDTMLTVTVPFAREGRSEAEKQGGRVRLTQDDIIVRCKPADLPAKVTFDLGSLPTGDHNISISKLPLPKGVTAHFKNDYSLVQVFMTNNATEVEAEVKPAASADAGKGAAPAAKDAAAPAGKAATAPAAKKKK